MKLSLFLSVGLLLTSFAFAGDFSSEKDDVVPPANPGGPVNPGTNPEHQGPVALGVFDCNEVGWLSFTYVFYNNEKQSKRVFLGDKCEDFASELRKLKKKVVAPGWIAVCSPKPTYMVRWKIDPYTGLTPVAQAPKPSFEKCRAEASDLMAE